MAASEPKREDMIRELSRIALGGYYDYQDVRKALMDRIRDVVRRKNEGIRFDVTEKKKAVRSFDGKYKDAKLGKLILEMKEEGKLTARETDYIGKMLEAAKAANRMEARYVPIMRLYLLEERIWTEYLCKVRGIGPRLASNLISRIDVHKAKRAYSLWKYAGLDVANGEPPRRSKGEKTTYNPELRHVMWNVVTSLLRQKNEKYTLYYQTTKAAQKSKHPLEEHLQRCTGRGEPSKNYKAHIENRTRRRVAKRFLADLFEAWNGIEGRP